MHEYGGAGGCDGGGEAGGGGGAGGGGDGEGGGGDGGGGDGESVQPRTQTAPGYASDGSALGQPPETA